MNPDSSEQEKQLTRELRSILFRRLPEVFKDPSNDDTEKFPITARRVQELAPSTWERDPPGALILVMRQAVSLLPEDAIPGGAISWRRVGELLFGFVRLPPKADGVRHNYSDYRSSAATEARLSVVPRTFQRNVVVPLREKIARILLDLTYDDIERGSSPRFEEVIESDIPDIVDRPATLNQVRDAISTGHRVVCVWGEPGTGKTVLTDVAARAIGSPIITLRAGNPDVLRDDITDALVTEGMEPTNWSETYSRATLKRILGGEDERLRSRVVVIDNVEDEELIWQLVPRRPSIPVLITMRSKPQSPDVQTVEVEDFTEDQACAFIRNRLDSASDAETTTLARVLGCRPLALDHATRFVRESRDISVPALIDELATNVTAGLDLVADRRNQTTRLVALYKVVLASVLSDDVARPVLDNFLAVTGKSGMSDRELLAFFMQSRAGGALDRIHFRAGLRALVPLGLIRESGKLLVMHPLSYEILRDLRGALPFEIEARYLKYVSSPEVADLLPQGNLDRGSAYAWLMSQVLEAGKQGLPEGWQLLHMVDDYTWIAVRSDQDGTYTVRYEVYPTCVYKWDYRTSVRAQVEPVERAQLFDAARQYYERVQPLVRHYQNWVEEGKLS